MRQRDACALLGLAAALAAPTSGPAVGAEASQSAPTFPSQVELVTVDAVVLDASGHTVPGLAREDFVVTEDGRAQDIASFETFVAEPPDEVPEQKTVATNEAPLQQRAGGRAFAILIDDVSIAPERAESARSAAASFLRSSVRDGDEVTVATSSGDVWWSTRIPEGTEDLLAVLSRVKGRLTRPPASDEMTEYEAFVITEYEDSPAASTASLSAGGGSASGRAPAASGDSRIGGGGIGTVKARVTARWQSALLCTSTNCDPMVRGRASEIDGRRRGRVALTLRAIRRQLNALALVHGRKSLLLFSDGLVQDRGPELREVAAASREANTAIYFIDVRGLIAQPSFFSAALPGGFQPPDPRDLMAVGLEERELAAAGAEDLADDTGGFSVRNTNDLSAGAERIANESRVFYLLGFHPPEGKSAREWRKLKVEVKRPGLTVRARRGYTLRLAGTEDAKREAKAKGKTNPGPDPAVARVLDSPHDATSIPLRAMTYVLDPRPKDLTRVLVAAEFDAGRLAVPATGGARLEISVLAVNRDSGRGFHHDDVLEGKDSQGPLGWRGFVREFELPAGITQTRVVVRDATSGAAGSVSQRFEVPVQGQLRLSTPILTDRLEPATGPQGRPRPALAAHRVFRPEGGLYVQFEVFGASRSRGAPQVSAGLEVLTSGGRTVRRADPTPITPDADARVVRLTGLPLDGMAEGSYELVLDVLDQAGGASVKQRESFVLSRTSGPVAQ